MRLTERARDAAALAAGAAWPLAFAPVHAWPVALASLAALFWLLGGTAPRAAALRGFAFGLGLFGTGVWWVFISMATFGGLHASLSLALTDGWTSGNGLGLGLTGTRRLVNDFELHSVPGEGTRVVITRWK